MKKRLLLLMFSLLLTFVLAGCDLFGGGTVTIPTDLTLPTTTAPITTEPDTTTTTVEPSTTTTVSVSPTDYTISFEENGGSDVTNIVSEAGTAVSEPIDPSKTGYTFVGWFSDSGLTTAYAFTTMPSQNITLYAKWQIITYTVTFYAEDGVTVLDTQTVDFGASAVPPEAPGKLGHVFDGWDKDFTVISGDTSIKATYRTHYAPLVTMVQETFGYDGMPQEEMDGIISSLMFVMDVETEEEVLIMMNDVFELGEGLMLVTDVAGLQAWFANLAVQGFTKEQITDLMVNAALMAIEMSANDYDPQRYLDNLAEMQADKLLAEAELDSIENELNNYCDIQDSELVAPCKAFFNALVQEYRLRREYYDEVNSAWQVHDDLFDHDMYYNLESQLDSYYYYLYAWKELDTADAIYNDYLAKLAGLSTEEQTMYSYYLNLYSTYETYRYVTLPETYELISGALDSNEQPISDIIEFDIFNRYHYKMDEIQNYTWMIEEQQRWIEEVEMEHLMMEDLRVYLWSEEGTIKLKTLAITLYDVAAGLVTNIDEATFQMILDLINGTYDETNPIPMEAADISSYALMIADIMSALSVSIDDADMANILALGTDILDIYLTHSDMDEAEKIEIMTLIETLAPVYIEHAGFIYEEIIDLLESVTPEKVQLILDFVAYMNNQGGEISLMMVGEEADPKEMIVYIAKIVDAFLYNNTTFDYNGIVDIAVDVYFDWAGVTVDEITIALIKTAVHDALSQIVLLSHDVALVDLENVTADDLANMYELYQRGMHLFEMVQSGDLSQFLVPYDYTDVHQLFVEFIDPWGDMDQAEVDAIIDLVMYTFGPSFETEADVLFTVLLFESFPEQFEFIDSFEDVQALYGQLAPMGFDNATIAGMIARFLDGYSDYVMTYLYDEALLTELTNAYNTAYAEYEQAQASFDDFPAITQTEINVYPDPLKTDMTQAWQAFLSMHGSENYYWEVYNNAQWENPNGWMWDDWNYNEIYNILNSVIALEYGEDWGDDYVYNDYLNRINLLSDDEKLLYMEALNAAETMIRNQYIFNNAINYLWTTYGETNSVACEWLQEQTSVYYDLNNAIWMAWNDVDSYRWQLDEMRGYEVWYHIDSFFTDSENIGLVEDVALIVLDEIGSLMVYTDTDSINLVIGLMNGSVDPTTLDLTPAGIAGYLDAFEAFFGYVFSSIDATDQETLDTFVGKLVSYYGTVVGMDSLDATALSNKIINYMNQFALLKAELTAFFPSITEADITVIMTAIGVMESLPEELTVEIETSNNYIRAIEMARIIDALLTGDVLDTDMIVQLLVPLYFDISFEFSYDGPDYQAEIILEIQTQIEAIILQAAVVGAIDYTVDELTGLIDFDDSLTSPDIEGITSADTSEINDLHLLIDELMSLFDAGLENYVPVV